MGIKLRNKELKSVVEKQPIDGKHWISETRMIWGVKEIFKNHEELVLN